MTPERRQRYPSHVDVYIPLNTGETRFQTDTGVALDNRDKPLFLSGARHVTLGKDAAYFRDTDVATFYGGNTDPVRVIRYSLMDQSFAEANGLSFSALRKRLRKLFERK